MSLTVIATTLLNVIAPYSVAAEKVDTVNIAQDDTEIITVTASRRVQALQDVPAAIVAIKPNDFSDAGLTTVSDIVEYTPGFSITRSKSQRGQGAITARGVSQLGNTAVVSIYVDDIPMTSNSGFAGGGTLFFDGLLGDIERIEMIKGPQGTLFGATSVGGAMRYITKKPALETTRSGVGVDFSSTKDGDFNQRYSGFVSLPVIDNKLGLTVAGFYDDHGGFVDRIDTTTGNIIKEDADSSRNKGFSADLLFVPTDKMELRLKALQQKSEFNGTSKIRLNGIDKKPTYGYLISDDQLSTNLVENTLVSGSLDYYFDELTLTATSSFVKYESDNVVDFTSKFSGLVDLIQGNPAGTTTDIPFASPLSSEKNVHELRITSDDDGSFEWLAGLYYADESTTSDQLAISQPGDFLAFQASFPSDYKEKSVFANATYYINDDFDLTAGMRYADTSMSLNFISDGPLAGGASNSSLPNANAKIKTYLLAARYRVNSDMSLYSRIASGYRPASANLSIANPITGEQLTQPILEQDDLWSYEIGAKGKVNNGLVHYDLSIWTLDWDNFQAPVYYFGVRGSGNAADGITATGFEASFDVDFDNGFTLITNLAYADSTLNSNEVELNGVKGAEVPGVPKWTASARAKYSFDWSANIIANISGGFRYTDGAPSAFIDGDIGDELVNITSDDYILVDINSGFVIDKTSVNFYVTNLLNEQAFASAQANNIPITGGYHLDATATPIMPRTVGVNMSYKF